MHTGGAESPAQGPPRSHRHRHRRRHRRSSGGPPQRRMSAVMMTRDVGNSSSSSNSGYGGGGGMSSFKDERGRSEEEGRGPQLPREPMAQRRLLSDEEARQRNLPKGAQLIAQVRKPLPNDNTRLQIAEALRRRKERKKRRKLLQEEDEEEGGGGGSGEDDNFPRQEDTPGDADARSGDNNYTFTVTTLPEPYDSEGVVEK